MGWRDGSKEVDDIPYYYPNDTINFFNYVYILLSQTGIFDVYNCESSIII